MNTGPDPGELARDLQRLRDDVRFAQLVRRTVADVSGFSTDLSRSFPERAGHAAEQLCAALDSMGGEASGLWGADILRRLSVLLVYLGSLGSRTDFAEDSLLRILAALDPSDVEGDINLHDISSLLTYTLRKARLLYQSAFTSNGQAVPDEFSLTLLELEQGLLSRTLGMSAELDRGPEGLPAGLEHLADIIRSETLAGAILATPGPDGRADRVRELTEECGSSDRPTSTQPPDFAREAADLMVSCGLAHAATGDPGSAVECIQKAIPMIERGVYHGSESAEKTLDLMLAHFLLGRLLSAGTPAIAVSGAEDCLDRPEYCLDRSVMLVETIRGGWAIGSSREDPLWQPLNQICIGALECIASIEGAGWTGLRIMEATRRRHLAGMLRGVRFLEPSAGPSLVTDLTDPLQLEEDQGSPGSDRWTDGLADDQLKERLSDFFAEAFLPSVVELQELEERCRGRATLAFLVLDGPAEEGSRVARAWVTPAGKATIKVVDLKDARAWLERWEKDPNKNWSEWPDTCGKDHTESLLPPDLIPADPIRSDEEPLPRPHLVVVPDGWLNSMPWAGLALDEEGEEFLVNRTDIYVVPSISVAEVTIGDGTGTAERAPVGQVHAALIDYTDHPAWPNLNEDMEVIALKGTDVEPLPTLTELLTSLANAGGSTTGVAIIGCHGERIPHEDANLGAGLVEGDGGIVGCLQLMSVPWPETVLLGCCHAGRIVGDVMSGQAPFGVPMALMARGATTVIGGTHQIPDAASDKLFGGWGDTRGLITRVLGGTQHPVAALNDVQRDWITVDSGESEPGSEEEVSRYRAPLFWARLAGTTLILPPVTDAWSGDEVPGSPGNE
jgi:hypothetical protein